MMLKPLLIAVILLCLAGSASARTMEGIVRKVYDGDTIELATRENNRLRVRLYGIDAPESASPDKTGQPFGAVSRRMLMFKIMGRKVSADIQEIDQYQRSVAIVRYAGRDINREMVAEGMAWAYRQYLQGPYQSEYIGAENRARSRRSGLWQHNNPTPPWEFRKVQDQKDSRKTKVRRSRATSKGSVQRPDMSVILPPLSSVRRER